MFLESCNDLVIGLSWFVLPAVGCPWSVDRHIHGKSHCWQWMEMVVCAGDWRSFYLFYCFLFFLYIGVKRGGILFILILKWGW